MLEQLLTQATDGLLMTSESDYPFTYVAFPDQRTRRLLSRTLLRLLALPADTPVERRPLTAMFRVLTTAQDWQSDQDKATVQRFENLQRVLTTQLTGTQVFRVGKEPEKAVYLLGLAAEGHWAGLATKVVET